MMESHANSSSESIPNTPPPRPVPSTDRSFRRDLPPTPEAEYPSPELAALSDDIFKVSPAAALKLLSAGVEALVRMTGDIPPTPPSSSSYTPHMRGMQAEKESIVRSHSEKNLARMREEAEAEAKAKAQAAEGQQRPQTSPQPTTVAAPASTPATAPTPSALPLIDGVRLRATPTPPTPAAGAAAAAGASAPLTPAPTPEPYVVIGADSQPLNLQHSAITRKFYSKKPPPIGVSDYLQRIHHFCPMSTAVYLATSVYIYRLAVSERAIAVTRRNAHRLLLAGLRVAMKALEDLSYPHAKLARVGGVGEVELARLEISFCFLAGFELVVREDEMRDHMILMKSGRGVGALGSAAAAGAVAAGSPQQMRLEIRPRGGRKPES